MYVQSDSLSFATGGGGGSQFMITPLLACIERGLHAIDMHGPLQDNTLYARHYNHQT